MTPDSECIVFVYAMVYPLHRNANIEKAQEVLRSIFSMRTWRR